MRNLIYILLYLLLCSSQCNAPYQADLACRNKSDDGNFRLSHSLQFSIKKAVISWAGGSVNVSIAYRIKNAHAAKPDSLDYNRFFLACSNGIPFDLVLSKPAAARQINPWLRTVVPTKSIDSVLHFISQGRYSREAAVTTFEKERFILRYSNGPPDTLTSVAMAD